MTNLYEDTIYGGFYTITGHRRHYIVLAGTDERGQVVQAVVPKDVFYQTFKRVGRKYENEI